MIKTNSVRAAATITVLSKAKIYGYDEMTHIGIKKKLFGLFSDYFKMLGAKFYCKHSDPNVIGLNRNYLAIF